MDSRYRELGFKQPEYLENPYGIRIYTGTKGSDDWCVEVPKALAQSDDKNRFEFEFNANLCFYLIDEHEALRIADKYTRIARKNKA